MTIEDFLCTRKADSFPKPQIPIGFGKTLISARDNCAGDCASACACVYNNPESSEVQVSSSNCDCATPIDCNCAVCPCVSECGAPA